MINSDAGDRSRIDILKRTLFPTNDLQQVCWLTGSTLGVTWVLLLLLLLIMRFSLSSFRVNWALNGCFFV